MDYNVQIWDTAGLEKYRSITKSYFHSASCIIQLIDVSNPFSLSKLDVWLDEIENNISDKENCQIVLALTKKDLKYQIDMNFLQLFCDRYDLKYFEVSSKSGENVNELFDFTMKQAIIRKNKCLLSQQLSSFKDGQNAIAEKNTQDWSINSVSLCSSKEISIRQRKYCC